MDTIIDYFAEYNEEDDTKKSADVIIPPEEFHKVEQHMIEFSYGRFLYVLVLHLIFYIVLGPFMIIFFFYKPGMPLLRNFGFVPSIEMYFIFQTILWMFNMANILLYACTENKNIFFVEVLYMNILLFLRCAVIAAKYASIHEMKWKLYNKMVLKPEFTSYDFYM